MKSALYMPIPKLCDLFGLPPDFHKARRVEPRMVEWLLTDPDEDDLLTVALLCAIARYGLVQHRPRPLAFTGLGS